MGSFEASYKDSNLHILSAELDGVRCIHYLTVVCTYKRDQQRGGGGTELNALWNKSWACAQALSHKCRCRCVGGRGGGTEAKQRYTVRETGCGKHVSKTRKIRNLKFSLFLSSSGYDNNVTCFVLRDLKTAQRY